MPLLLLGSQASAVVLFRCHHDGVARVEPCCPQEMENLHHAETSLVRGCCNAEVASGDAEPVVGSRRAESPGRDLSGVGPVLAQASLPPPAPAALRSRPARHIGSGPPIHLWIRTLII